MARNHKSNLTASQRKMMRRFNTFLERNVPDLLIKPIKTLTSSSTKVIVDQEDNNMVEEKDKKEEKETIEEKLSSLVLTTAISCYGDSIKAVLRSPLLVKQLQRDNIDRTFKNSPELVKSLINLSTTLVYSSIKIIPSFLLTKYANFALYFSPLDNLLYGLNQVGTLDNPIEFNNLQTS